MLQKLIAGDSLNFTTTVAGYTGLAGWTLKYKLTPRTATNTVVNLVGTAEAGAYRIQAAAATTASWAPDTYTWASWVEKAGEVYTVGYGVITVVADPRQATAGFDDRSQDERDLDALNQVIHARINGGAVLEYTIGNRSLKKEPIPVLIELRSRLQMVVSRQRRAQAAAAGLGRSGRMGVRFT